MTQAQGFEPESRLSDFLNQHELFSIITGQMNNKDKNNYTN